MVKVRALFLVLMACGPDATNVPFLREAGDHCPVGGCVDASFSLDQDAYIVPMTDPLEPWDAGDGGPLTGIFAVEATVKANVGVEVQSKQLYRLRIYQQGTFIHQKTTLCSLTLPSVPNVATLAVPIGLEEMLWTLPNENEGNYLSNGDTVIGAQYSPPAFVEVLGANLTNPATDPLPTIDSGTPTYDDAGHPGVPLLAQTVVCGNMTEQLYVALRVKGALAGTVQTPDLIKGEAQVKLEDSVLGYSDSCLAVASTIKINVEPNSPFSARHVGPQFDINGDGNVDCAEIIDQAAAIFPDWTQP